MRHAIVATMAAICPAAASIAQENRSYDFSTVKRELAEQCSNGTFSGVVLVRAHGRDVFEHVCGEADLVNRIAVTRDTRFKIYSTSKLMTALTVMKLIEMRVLALDAPASTYIPELPQSWSDVTIRQLLQHTSGIPDLTEDLVFRFQTDRATAMKGTLASAKEKNAPLRNAPGAEWHYNNFGFELLAEAATRATGTPFADLLQKYVFDPAGMTTASVEKPYLIAGHPIPVAEDGLAFGYNGEPGKLQQAVNFAFIQLGAGAVRASVADFAALDRAIGENRIVSPASLRTMTEKTFADAPKYRRSFGLGIIVSEVDGVHMAGHSGGTNGYISDFERYPDDDAMMIALTNRGFVKTRWLADDVGRVLRGKTHVTH